MSKNIEDQMIVENFKNYQLLWTHSLLSTSALHWAALHWVQWPTCALTSPTGQGPFSSACHCVLPSAAHPAISPSAHCWLMFELLSTRTPVLYCKPPTLPFLWGESWLPGCTGTWGYSVSGAGRCISPRWTSWSCYPSTSLTSQGFSESQPSYPTYY